MRQTLSSWAKSSFLSLFLVLVRSLKKRYSFSAVVCFILPSFSCENLNCSSASLPSVTSHWCPSFLMSGLIVSCCSRHSSMVRQALISHTGAETFCRIDFWSIALESEETMSQVVRKSWLTSLGLLPDLTVREAPMLFAFKLFHIPGCGLPRALLRSCESLLKAFSAASAEKVELTAVFSHDVFWSGCPHR